MKTTELQEAQLDAIVGGINAACMAELSQFAGNGNVYFKSSKPCDDGYVLKENYSGTFNDDAINAALKMAQQFGSVTFVAEGVESKTYSYQEFSDLVNA